MKVREIVTGIISRCGMEPLAETCDRIIEGSPDREVTGIVTTFMATVDVIEQAHRLGANFIITHEPTYFTGDDRKDWLLEDSVYLAKRELIKKYGITIWRFHDHMHMGRTDGIYEGMLRELGWETCRMDCKKENDSILRYSDLCYQIPQTTVAKLADELKEKLGMQVIRIVGKEDMAVSRVGLLVGGGSLGLGDEAMPMQLMEKENLDVIVCGEITEWTLCAYVRDAAMMGKNRALIIPGHNRTEEAGMKYLPEWLAPVTGDIPVTFVEAGEPFLYR
ncbi:MAG: Nif3-like dinuclear metal center hexameric protein [Eubacteriales bacterium]|nr:Nif3-like dinuclear metal center hexameric protein [Eubacteriales bacterium]